eukprot:jgi/Ulvmu1/1386/UM011_0114.1
MAEMDVELPKSLIKRIVKAKLAEQAELGDDDRKRDVQTSRDATVALSHATKIFITYVSSAAHDICREHNRTTVAPQDINAALVELGFSSFLPDLQELLSDIQSKRKSTKDAAGKPAKEARTSA